MHYSFILKLSLLLLLVKISIQQKINLTQISSQDSPCKVKLSNGKLIDLTSLDNPSNPRKVLDGDFSYSFNPCSVYIQYRIEQNIVLSCSGLTCGSMQSVIMCQSTDVAPIFTFNCGDTSSFKLHTKKNVLTMSYTGVQAGISRKSNIECVCDPIESFLFVRQNPTNTYDFIFKSPCCCPDGCVQKDTFSIGTIISITIISTVAFYLVSGFAYKKFVKKSKGLELIPNTSFWSNIFGNIKDGFQFLANFLLPKKSSYQNI